MMKINYLPVNSLVKEKFIDINSAFSGLLVLISFVFVLITSFANVAHAATESDLNEIAREALHATPNLNNGRELFYNCAVCHSPEGWGTPSGRFPQIAGQHKSVIVKQLTDIHLGNRDNPTMRPFTDPIFNLGSQALADLAAYISQLPMVPDNSIGYGFGLDIGKKLYDDNCKQCHLENGEGDPGKFYPRIQGQHFRYLERQLIWIKDNKRRNADAKMVKQLQKFNYREVELIADYVSRLKPDKSLLAESIYWKNPDFRAGFNSAPRE